MNQWRTFQFFEKQLIKEEGSTEPNQELKVIFNEQNNQFYSSNVEFSISFYQIIILRLSTTKIFSKNTYMIMPYYINYFVFRN